MWGLVAQIAELREEIRVLKLIKPRRSFDMRVAQEQVELFMRRMGEHVADGPEVGTPAENERRYQIILEEVEEYRTACEAGDLVAIADAIGDILYTALGAGCLHGVDCQPVVNEIHESNLTKDIDPASFKKAIKGPGYKKPRIAELLIMQPLAGYGHGV